MAEIAVRNLRKTLGKNTVIKDISFEVSRGEFCILLGPSGCGKSTILRLIAGLEHQDSGEIYIDSREISALTPRERDVAMVFQSYALYPHMSAFENMAFPLKLRKSPRDEIETKVREAARLLDIEDLLGRRPAQLSGGQRQRVALGRAIVRSPRLFLFDEPLSNLDAKLRSAMRIELAALHKKLRTTMIYVTHDQVEAMTLGQKIILLDRGEIMQVATPRELYERPANLFAAAFVGTPQINLFDGKVSVEGGRMFFRAEGVSLEVSEHGALRQYEGKEVTMGVRPESLFPGEGFLKGAVEIVEHVGSEAVVYIAVAGARQRVAVKVPPDFSAGPGAEISLSADAGALHFFHEGRRIN